MLLQDLLKDIKNIKFSENTGFSENVFVSGVTCDSRQVESGYVFVCVKGTRFDSHDCAAEVLAAGAAAVVVQRDLGLEKQILVEDTRQTYAVLCANFFGRPADRLKLIGVTGTNGKTTTTYLLKHILECAGKKVGLIGTIQNEIEDITLPAKHTTPDPYQLHSMFLRMAQAGCEYVVMEVSSHALDQQRVAGCHFHCAIFSNLTQDHLDYHLTMENYYQAKRRLFNMCDRAVINLDDSYGKRLAGEVNCEKQTFSIESDCADYTAKDIRTYADGSRFMLLGNSVIQRIKLGMPGAFSVANAMAAAVCCMAIGLPIEVVSEGLNSCLGVSGRTEVLRTGIGFTVIRDYAHSPDGLEKVLTAVREFAPARLVTLFGCAGNRDRTKRKLMAEIVARLSDFVVLTSDNPRDEDPLQIIEDAKPGLLEHPNVPYKIMPDRYEAIEWVLHNTQPDDVIILAGKGHEDYQVLKEGTIYFDEKVIVSEILDRIGNEG